MKFAYLIYLLSFPFVSWAQAPNVQWQKAYGGTGYETGRKVLQTTDSGYIIVGTGQSTDGDLFDNHGFNDIVVIKTNNAGGVQWRKCLGGSLSDHCYDMQLTSDGGYIIAGATGSNDGDVSGVVGDNDGWLIKLSSLGDIQWQKCVGGPDYDGFWSVRQTADGGYITAGMTYSLMDGNHGISDFWVVRFDATGSVQWRKCYGGSGTDLGYSIIETTGGGYLATGLSRSSNGDATVNHGMEDCWVVKLDDTGQLVWQKSLGGSRRDYGWSIEQRDGGYIIAARSESNDGDVSLNYGGADFWLIRLNDTGMIESQKSFGGSGDDEFQSITKKPGGGFIIAGSTTSNDHDVSGNHGLGAMADFWITDVSETGEILWQKCLGGTGDDGAGSVIESSDGGIVVCGYTSSHDGDVTAPKGDSDIWLVKLATLSGVDRVTNNDKTSIFPNPTSGDITINGYDHPHVRIYNVIGQVMIETRGPSQVSLSELPAGTYLAHVLDEQSNIQLRETLYKQ